MTYRGSENTMLGTGRQPFLVVVKIKIQKVCFGTLISPMHVLTLASCLMQPKVSNVCFKKIWTNHISDTVLQFFQIFLKQTLHYRLLIVRLKPLFWFWSDTEIGTQIGRYFRRVPLPIPTLHFKGRIQLLIARGPLKLNFLPKKF